MQDKFKIGDKVKLPEWKSFCTIVATDGYGMIELEEEGDARAWYDTNILNFIKEKKIVENEVKQVSESVGHVQQDEFKTGDTVWCLLNGEGTVLDFDKHDAYPIFVDFGGAETERYTADGKLYHNNQNRCLFFSEPKVEASTTRPFVPTLIGKIVVIRELGVECCIAEITEEYEDKIRYIVPGVSSQTYTSMKSKLVAIREVTSENLL